MKNLFFSIFLCLIAICSLNSQECADYDCMMKEAKLAYENDNFLLAFKKVRAAKALVGNDQSKENEIDQMIYSIFNGIEEQRRRAVEYARIAERRRRDYEDLTDLKRRRYREYEYKERNYRQIVNELEDSIHYNKIYIKRLLSDIYNLENEKQNLQIKKAFEIDSLLNITKLMFFYANKFGLAYKNEKYGYVDKNGKVTIAFQYSKAMPFDDTGYAEVEYENHIYLIDSTDRKYIVTKCISNAFKGSEVIDLSGSKFKKIPKKIYSFSQVKILRLKNNKISETLPRLKNLYNLEILDLSNNNISFITPTIGNLTKLKFLYLQGNPINKLDRDKITKLLPNCHIVWD